MAEHEQIRSLLNKFRFKINELAKIEQLSKDKVSVSPDKAIPWVCHQLTFSANIVELSEILKKIHLLVRIIHHEKEEAILFPYLALSPKIREGGPRCSFFVKYVMEETHVSDLLGAIKASGETFEEHPRSLFVQEMFLKNTPLTVPLREHEYGHQALQYMQNLVSQALAGEKINFKHFQEFYELYFNLMDLHIRKENECLFILARDILTSDEQTRLELLAIEFENKLTAEISIS